MPLFYRGAPVGSHSHTNNAVGVGITSRFPGMNHSLPKMIQHITRGTAASPYISLTRSYAVAWHYAVIGSGGLATSTTPAYVYEIDLNAPLPLGLTVFDPVKEIGTSFPVALSSTYYQHNGLPSVLVGVVDNNRRLLGAIPPLPPLGGVGHPAVITDELRTLCFAMRDAEILAHGTIPGANVVHRYDVW